MKRTRTAILSACAISLLSMSGCGFIHQLQAKNSLNEGVREFNKGKYQTAQMKFEHALEFDRENANAQLFYARAVNARFDQNLTEDLGLKTLQAYDQIISSNRDNPKAVDQALAFKAKVFGQLSDIEPAKTEEYKQEQRNSLLQRASLSTADNKTKAAVFYTIGQGFWQESYNYSRRFLKNVGGKPTQLPVPPEVQGKMKPLVSQAHEYLQKALSIQPDYADAWIYEKLVYIEELKLENNPANRKQLEAKLNEAQDNYKKFHDLQQQQAAAAATEEASK